MMKQDLSNIQQNSQFHSQDPRKDPRKDLRKEGSDTRPTGGPEKPLPEIRRARRVVSVLIILLVLGAAIYTWSAYQDQISVPDGGENDSDPGVGK